MACQSSVRAKIPQASKVLTAPEFQKDGVCTPALLTAFVFQTHSTFPKWPSAYNILLDLLSALVVPALPLFTLFIAFISHLAIYFQFYSCFYTHLTLLLILKNDCSRVVREGRNK